MLIGAKKNYRGEEKLQGRRKITGAKKILLKVYQLSGFLDFNTGAVEAAWRRGEPSAESRPPRIPTAEQSAAPVCVLQGEILAL